MRLIYAIYLAVVILLAMPIESESSGMDVFFSSKSMVCGSLILVTVKADKLEKPQLTWMKKQISLVYNRGNASWQGFIAADLNQKAGLYEAVVCLQSGLKKIFYIRVNYQNYGSRKLRIPKEKFELTADSLRRVKSELAVVKSTLNAEITKPVWDGGFLMPVAGDILGTFGKRSIINNVERSPHTGVDMRGNTGDPVSAINSGRVILVADHFFTGKSLFMDHGGGIRSMYFHLDKILVKDGENIEKGQIIGLVGATGRATGPHLHWGVRINGARVNPVTLIELSERLEE